MDDLEFEVGLGRSILRRTMKILNARVSAAIWLVLTPPACAAVYPPDTAYDGPRTVPSVSRPAYLQPMTSNQSLVTNNNAFFMLHDYSKDQPWNLDMTLIKLQGAVFILGAKAVLR